MARTKKDFFMLAIGISSFIVGFILIGNFLLKNLLWGAVGIALIVVGIYLTGFVMAGPR